MRLHFPQTDGSDSRLTAFDSYGYRICEVALLYVRVLLGLSLAFPICSTTNTFFLGWVSEARTTKS
jgi:hypothetical protein